MRVMSATTFSLEQAALRIRKARVAISGRLVNRDAVIHQAFLALLTGEHLLLQSRTGTGKSLLAEQIFSCFTDARIFKVQASKEQQPDTFFGGLDIEQLKTGRIMHNTSGSLVESEFGFIDEIFDANDFTLRALLSLLNERALIRGVQYMQADTHTVIAATNYLRVNEVTEAILDRFLYKAVILPDKQPLSQYRIAQRYIEYEGKVSTPTERIPLADLQQWHRIITGDDDALEIQIPSDVVYSMNLVIRQYEYARNRALKESQGAHNDFYVSPRTQAKALDALRALAFMNARSEVVINDIQGLSALFATSGIEDEQQAFDKAWSGVYKSLSVSNGFDQLRVLLDFDDVLNSIRENPMTLRQPINTLLDSLAVRRSIMDWFKDTFGNADVTIEHNKRALRQFLHDFVPACDEVRELKQSIEKEMEIILAGASKE
jgi:MoxR-like ATPase